MLFITSLILTFVGLPTICVAQEFTNDLAAPRAGVIQVNDIKFSRFNAYRSDPTLLRNPSGSTPEPFPILFACIPIGAEIPTAVIRGTVVRVEKGGRETENTCLPNQGIVSGQDDIMTIRGSTGERRLWFAPDSVTFAVTMASIGEVQKGSGIAVISVLKADGVEEILSVTILPAVGGGREQEWDLAPSSLLTVGSVIEVSPSGQGNVITLAFQGRTKTVLVQPQTAVVAVTKADQSILQPGMAIFVLAQENECDCAWQVSRVFVGMDGLVPPL